MIVRRCSDALQQATMYCKNPQPHLTTSNVLGITCHHSFWTFSLRVHGRAGRSELSPQMDPQLRGAAKPRLYALFLPSGLLACMQRVGSLVGALALLRTTRRQSLIIQRCKAGAHVCWAHLACDCTQVRVSVIRKFPCRKDRPPLALAWGGVCPP